MSGGEGEELPRGARAQDGTAPPCGGPGTAGGTQTPGHAPCYTADIYDAKAPQKSVSLG